ncbi:DUF3597 domain-containing protein [Ochrobactrum sp. GPK 3]|uniref:DUF3597 domain-containing protein n=1 Tax=Brucella sp. 22210 TaxID=3453892 RepID=UPI0031385987
MGFIDIIKNFFVAGATANPRIDDLAAQEINTSTAQTSDAARKANADTEALLDNLAAQNDLKLNWRTSAIDLMKLLDLDASLPARRKLAQKWGYAVQGSNAAAMNIWLHKELIKLLQNSGGKLPVNLKEHPSSRQFRGYS